MLGPAPADRSERDVYLALREQLPSDWVVVPDVQWSQRFKGDGAKPTAYVRDGQADFVVLAPKFGLLVIEVKGSRFVKIEDDGCWYRSADGRGWERITKRPPPQQAMENAYEVTRLLTNSLQLPGFPSRFGWLVAYPQGSVTKGNLQTFDSTTAVFKHQMVDLRNRIRVALQARGDDFLGEAMTAQVALQMGYALVNHPLQIGPSDTGVDAKADADVIERLTRQQFAALQGVYRHPRVAVTGPAGSGKTVLAIWRLAALVAEGRNAKYLCFNKALAEHLQLRNPELKDHIHNVDSYFRRLAPRREPGGPDALQQFFTEDLPGDVIDEVGQWQDEQKLDALIIDEGQDFGELRLLAAQSLVREAGSYLYCSDDRQDLYDQRRRKAIGAEVVFSLIHNCRNTVRINETSARVLAEHIPPMPGLPEGVETTVQAISSSGPMAKAAWRLASQWGSEKGRIVILSPYRLENSAMAGELTGYGKRLVTSLVDWELANTVFFSTIRAFKGLEADTVIVTDIDVPREQSALDRSDLYVAFTRARARLAVLCRSEDAVRFIAGK